MTSENDLILKAGKKEKIHPQLQDFWLPLDNAAKIYPAVRNSEQTAVFRISVVLKDNIRIKELYKAIGELEDRFPYYKVRLQKGFFWYFLEYINLKFPVEMDQGLPCRSLKNGQNELLVRILVSENTLSVEFSHILTDGGGGLAFLKSILLTYFKQCGQIVPEGLDYHKPDQHVKEGEFEDAYQRYFKKNFPVSPKYFKAFHLPFRLRKKPRYGGIKIILPLKKIHAIAKEKKVSITTFLIAVYLMALQEIYQQMGERKQKKSNKILRIQVPVNLRALYPTDTMRNFSLYLMPEIDLRLGTYTFDEILTKTYYLMQLETDKKMINKMISRNVGSEKRIEVRSTPLALKSLVLKYKYKALGANLYSGVITNLGKVSFSPEIDQLIDHFVFVPPPPNTTLKVNSGVIGFADKLVLWFGNISGSDQLEQKFIQLLKDHGVDSEVKKINHS